MSHIKNRILFKDNLSVKFKVDDKECLITCLQQTDVLSSLTFMLEDTGLVKSVFVSNFADDKDFNDNTRSYFSNFILKTNSDVTELLTLVHTNTEKLLKKSSEY